MKALVKIMVFGAAFAALGAANLILATEPVNTAAILDGTRTASQLEGAGIEDDAAGTQHIEGLTFVQTFSRPLFSQTRRKYEPPKPPPAPEPVPVVKQAPPPPKVITPPNFRLLGISIDGAASRALIAGGPNPHPQWYAKGEPIGDWELTAVTDQAVTVSQSGHDVAIPLYPDLR